MAETTNKGWTDPRKLPKRGGKSPDPHKDELQLVLDSFTYAKNYWSNKRTAFRDWQRMYDQVPAAKPVFRANLFIPLVRPLIDTVLPRMVANNPSFRYEPREKMDQRIVKQATILADYQLDRMKFFQKLKLWVKDTLTFGTGITKLTWRRDEEEGYNDPWLDLVDLQDFYPDPKATEVQGGDFMIHRTVVSKQWLKNQVDAEGNPLYDLDAVETEWTEEMQDVRGKLFDRSSTQGEIPVFDDQNIGSPFKQSVSKQMELLEYWGINPNDKDREYVIAVVNRQTVVRKELNPYNDKRPFCRMMVNPRQHNFYGDGMVKPIEHLQYELNDIRNQRMDNVNLILNRMWVVNTAANVDKQDLVSRPGGIIEEAIPNGIRPLDIPDITSSAYQEEAIVKDDAMNAVGVTDIIQGNLRGSNEEVPGTVLNKTATGAQVAVEQAGSRFKYYMQNLEDSLEEFGEMLFSLNQQFMDEDKFIRIAAPSDYETQQRRGFLTTIKEKIGLPTPEPDPWAFERVDADAIRNAKLDVKVKSGSTQPIEERMKQMKVWGLIEGISKFPITTPETYIALAEEFLEAYDVDDKDRILSTFQAPEGDGPETKVSVSLRGELNDFQAAEIARGAGASPGSTDPKLVGRLMAQERADELSKDIIRDAGKMGIQEKAAVGTIQTNAKGNQSAGPGTPRA